MINKLSSSPFVSITVPLPPSANRLTRRMGRRMVKSDEARYFAAQVSEIGRLDGLTPLVGRLAATLTVFREADRGDGDNRVKACLDALQGVAYANDKQVVMHLVDASRFDKLNPRVEIQVWPFSESVRLAISDAIKAGTCAFPVEGKV